LQNKFFSIFLTVLYSGTILTLHSYSRLVVYPGAGEGTSLHHLFVQKKWKNTLLSGSRGLFAATLVK